MEIKKRKFQGTLWEYEKPKVNVTQRSLWNYIYVTLTHENVAKTSLLILLVDRLMKANSFSSFALVL
jgi:hypothetical protein